MGKTTIAATITRRIKKTVTIEPDQLEKLVREAVGCPYNADVEFDAGYECLREVRITWEWQVDGE